MIIIGRKESRMKRNKIEHPNIPGTELKAADLSAASAASVLRQLAKRANQRLVRLERAGQTQYAYGIAKKYLQDIGRNRFAETEKRIKNLTRSQLTVEINAAIEFLTAKTSTLSGIKAVQKSAVDRLRVMGYNVDNGDFFAFLKSDEYKAALRKITSDEIMRQLDEALYNGVSLDTIIADYEDYLAGEKTFQEIEKSEKTGAYMSKSKRKKYSIIAGNRKNG